MTDNEQRCGPTYLSAIKKYHHSHLELHHEYCHDHQRLNYYGRIEDRKEISQDWVPDKTEQSNDRKTDKRVDRNCRIWGLAQILGWLITILSGTSSERTNLQHRELAYSTRHEIPRRIDP